MGKQFYASQINNSATIVDKAASEIADARGKAVKYDESGKLVLASTAGEAVIGIALITTGDPEGKVLAGEDVDVQIKDIGQVVAGAAIAKGAEVTTDNKGCIVTAAAGNFIIGTALRAASGAGAYIPVQINKMGYKPSAS